MNISESVTIAFDVIRSHKMRSFLTLLGIIIGVSAIIGMQSLIRGFQIDIERQMQRLGSDVFQVQKYPAINVGGRNREQYRNRKDITWDDSKAIEEHCRLVGQVGPEAWNFGVTVKYRDKKTSPTMTLAGGVPAFFPNNSYFIEEGRSITESDVEHNRQVIVIGYEIVEELFPYQSPIGQEVNIDGRRYKVIGTIEEQGSRFGESKDNRVVIPLSTFLKYYGKERSLNITVQSKRPDLIEASKEEVIGVLRAARKVPPGEPNDFEIWSTDNLIESFNNMTRAVKIGAIVVVSFALLVAGIGIMNIMMVSINERTREIGVRVAIGAKRRDIKWQFLVEAIMLSEVGGVIGVLVGVGIGQFVALVSPVPAAIPVGTVILGFVFCSLVGLIFGTFPAIKASKMDPIEALRYE
jgi:putative ABC transport system permease protein